jgi:hypothetical protein
MLTTLTIAMIGFKFRRLVTTAAIACKSIDSDEEIQFICPLLFVLYQFVNVSYKNNKMR